jgi:hypothetical protein
MKMDKKEYLLIKNELEKHVDKIKEYIPKLKEQGNYDNFEVRLSFDCYYQLIPREIKRSLSDELNDKHLFTGLKKALKELEIL